MPLASIDRAPDAMADAAPVRVFVSYAWEDEAYRTWVKRLGVTLRGMGVDVRLDAWSIDEGQTIAEFMNREVRAADKILILCSPGYRTKVHAKEEGVKVSGAGWESMLVGSGVFGGSLPPDRVVVALARGAWLEAAPTFLEGQLYVDLTDESRLEAALQDLVRRLTGLRSLPPPLGPLPANLAQPPAEPLVVLSAVPTEASAPTTTPSVARNRWLYILVALTIALGTFGWKRHRPANDDPAIRGLIEDLVPRVVELSRTADDLDTGSSFYLQQPPESEAMFARQLEDLNRALGAYNKARSELGLRHDELQRHIAKAGERRPALRDAASDLLNGDVAPFSSIAPPALDPRLSLEERYRTVVREWNEHRTVLKGQLSRLNRGTKRFEQVLFQSNGGSPAPCP